MLTEFAPAKLNLYLHITGRRADGYHDLDSLAVFADVGDEIHLTPSTGFHFNIKGPYAAPLLHEPSDHNLAVKAAQSLAQLTGQRLEGMTLTLTKNLPVASGIGGGSSDAAATLRLLARYWGLRRDDARLVQAAQQHGQDVPVCLVLENNYITAKGTAPAPALPRCHVVMVNPNKGLSTPSVYKEYREGSYSFSPRSQLTTSPRTMMELVLMLKERTNDLYAPACRLMPEIIDVIEALGTSNGCLLARMSGSGATCFGLFADLPSAEKAAADLRRGHPAWWTQTTMLPLTHK